VLAAAEFVPAPEHALISQLALDEPRVFEATGVDMLSRRCQSRLQPNYCLQTDMACPGEAVPLTGLRGGYRGGVRPRRGCHQAALGSCRQCALPG
jgi:hypothetical protein